LEEEGEARVVLEARFMEIHYTMPYRSYLVQLNFRISLWWKIWLEERPVGGVQDYS
jgi:hypothetical protein